MKQNYFKLEMKLAKALREQKHGYDPRNHEGSYAILQAIMKGNRQ